MKRVVKDGIKNILGMMGYEIHKKNVKNEGPLTKLSDGLEFFETKTGECHLPKYADGDGIAYAIKHDMIFDENVYNIGKRYIKDNSIILDVGSNFGQMAVLFSKLQPNTQVYALEASPVVYPILKKNATITPHPCR